MFQFITRRVSSLVFALTVVKKANLCELVMSAIRDNISQGEESGREDKILIASNTD